MEPKPLTKDIRERIYGFLACVLEDLQKPGDPWRTDVDKAIMFTSDLLVHAIAAEEYWREAVKNADVCGEIGAPCPWCGARTYDQNIEVSHHYGCEYLEAQD